MDLADACSDRKAKAVCGKFFYKNKLEGIYKKITNLCFFLFHFIVCQKQIRWENRLRFDNGSVCKISVDGTDFKIRTPKPFWKGWFSFKFKKAGLRYEVALAIQSGEIVWANGPFPAGRFPDITIFRLGLKRKLLDAGERTEADDGYRGEALCVDLPKEGCFVGGQLQQLLKQRIRSRHETVNARFKNFGCLEQRFRHKLNRHKICFDAILVITQLALTKGEEPLFEVRNYRTETLADLV